MTAIANYIAITRYMVVTDWGKPGVEGRTYASFDDACDACDEYAERMDDDDDSLVYAIEFAAGTISDITIEAMMRIAQRVNARCLSMPDWIAA